jgi:hypothetical protein
MAGKKAMRGSNIRRVRKQPAKEIKQTSREKETRK